MKKWKTQVKGITLIALVVTIIVLLILAGIAISLTIGNNGLFSRAENAANTWRRAEANETEEMKNFEDLYDNTVKDLGLAGEKQRETFTFKIDGIEVTAYEGDTWYTWLNDVKNGLHPGEFANGYYEPVKYWIIEADTGVSEVFCKFEGVASGAYICYKDNTGHTCSFQEAIRSDIEYIVIAS